MGHAAFVKTDGSVFATPSTTVSLKALLKPPTVLTQ
jgi:hypothetical protein